MIFRAFWFGLTQMLKQIKHVIVFVIAFAVVKIIFSKLRHLIQIEKPTLGEVIKKLSYDALLFVILALIIAAIMVCIIKLFLDVYDNKPTRLKNMLICLYRFYLKYVVVVVLLDVFYLILFIFGTTFFGLFIWSVKINQFYFVWFFGFLFLCVIIYALYTFSFLIFSNYILIDEERTPLQAIYQTIHFSREKRLKLFWFLIRYIIFFTIIYSLYLTLFTYLRGMEVHWKNAYYYIEPLRMIALALIYFVGLSMYVYTYKKLVDKKNVDDEVPSCLFSGVNTVEEVTKDQMYERKIENVEVNMELEKKKVVYDFDKTLYSKETGTNFYFSLIKEHPFMLYALPLHLIGIILYVAKMISLEKLKSIYFIFLEGKSLEEVQALVENYWVEECKNLYSEVLKTVEENKEMYELILITASPRILVEPLGIKLGFTKVIGTEFQEKKGKFISKLVGKNCKKSEKVKRLREYLEILESDILEIEKFYSDSAADMPLFDLAKEKYWINNGSVVEGLPQRVTKAEKMFNR
ncbi:MAG: HAD-IB family hydrolase [Fusobacteria bacterium]|nr:HAD-IB family hydrolase [Fusobacteriota bacterium]